MPSLGSCGGYENCMYVRTFCNWDYISMTAQIPWNRCPCLHAHTHAYAHKQSTHASAHNASRLFSLWFWQKE
jgi:hypothetical protein